MQAEGSWPGVGWGGRNNPDRMNKVAEGRRPRGQADQVLASGCTTPGCETQAERCVEECPPAGTREGNLEGPAHADVYGVNAPAQADFKLPTRRQLKSNNRCVEVGSAPTLCLGRTAAAPHSSVFPPVNGIVPAPSSEGW